MNKSAIIREAIASSSKKMDEQRGGEVRKCPANCGWCITLVFRTLICSSYEHIKNAILGIVRAVVAF